MSETLDIDRLRKVEALTRSPAPGEAAAARTILADILKSAGKTIADLPSILSPATSQPGGIMIDFGEWLRQTDPEEHKRWVTEIVDRRKKDFKDRAETLARYGSVEAVIAPCERESMLREAVRKWSTFCDPPDQRWTQSIDGCSDPYGKLPERVIAAISTAYPLPGTIEDAIAEHDYWDRRGRELLLVVSDTCELDFPATIRRNIVRGAIRFGLPARTIHDAIARSRFLLKDDPGGNEPIKPILADLEYLASLPARPSQNYTVTEKQCPVCHRAFVARSTARTCSDACRQRLSRSRRGVTAA